MLFTEDTPLRLIETILPDVLVKGGDYTVQTVVGAELVQKAGGRVELIPLIEGLSTTATIKKMKSPGAAPNAPAGSRPVKQKS